MDRPTYRAKRWRMTPAVCETGLAIRFGGLWSSGSGVGRVSLRNADTVARRFAHPLPWVSTTPFGAPVDPDVNRINASASSETTGTVSDGRPACRVTDTSSITAAASIEDATSDTSPAGADGCTRIAAAPRSQTAMSAGRNRSSLPTRTTTRAPAETSRESASPDAAEARSPTVHGPSSSTYNTGKSGRSAARHANNWASEPDGSISAAPTGLPRERACLRAARGLPAPPGTTAAPVHEPAGGREAFPRPLASRAGWCTRR